MHIYLQFYTQHVFKISAVHTDTCFESYTRNCLIEIVSTTRFLTLCQTFRPNRRRCHNHRHCVKEHWLQCKII